MTKPEWSDFKDEEAQKTERGDSLKAMLAAIHDDNTHLFSVKGTSYSIHLATVCEEQQPSIVETFSAEANKSFLVPVLESDPDDDIVPCTYQQQPIANNSTAPPTTIPVDGEQQASIVTVNQPEVEPEIVNEKNAAHYKIPTDLLTTEQQPSGNNALANGSIGSPVVRQPGQMKCKMDDNGTVSSSENQQTMDGTAHLPPVDKQIASNQPNDDPAQKESQTAVDNINTVPYIKAPTNPPSAGHPPTGFNLATSSGAGNDESPVVHRQIFTECILNDNTPTHSTDQSESMDNSTTVPTDDEKPSNIVSVYQPEDDPVQKEVRAAVEKNVQCHPAVRPQANNSAQAMKAGCPFRKHRIIKVTVRLHHTTPSRFNFENQSRFAKEMIDHVIIFCFEVFGSIVFAVIKSLMVFSYLGFFENKAPSVANDQQLFSNDQKGNKASIATEDGSTSYAGCDYLTEGLECTVKDHAVHMHNHRESTHSQRHLETSDGPSEIPMESSLKKLQPLPFEGDQIVKSLPDQKKVIKITSVSGKNGLIINQQGVSTALGGLEYNSNLNEDLRESALAPSSIAAVDDDKEDKKQFDGEAHSIATQALLFPEDEAKPISEEVCNSDENSSDDGTTYLELLDGVPELLQIPDKNIQELCIGDENLSIDEVTYLDSFEQSNADSMLVVSTARPVERTRDEDDDYGYWTEGKFVMFCSELNNECVTGSTD